MKKVLLLCIFFLSVEASQTENKSKIFLYETLVYGDKTVEKRKNFLKLKTVSFLTREQLDGLIEKDLNVENLNYLNPKEYNVFYGVEVDEDDRDPYRTKLGISFNFENNQSVYIGTFFYSRGYNNRATTVIELRNKENKSWIANSEGYIVKNLEGSHELISLQLIDTSNLNSNEKQRYFKEGYISKPLKVVFVTEVDNQTYIYGIELQIYREDHTSKRFTKLDKKGNHLRSDAYSWSCTYDKETGLIWENKTPNNDYRYAWGEWSELIDSVNKANLCGFDDWRVPNNGEIYSITNYGQIYTNEDRLKQFKSDFFSYPLMVWTSYRFQDEPKGYSVKLKYIPTLNQSSLSNRLSLMLVRGEKKIPAMFYYRDKNAIEYK